MAIATSYGAFIAGEWVHGEGGDEIEVRAPYDNSLVGTRHAGLRGAGRRRGGGGEGGVPGLAAHAAAHAGRAVPARVRPLHGAQRGDRGDDRPRGRQDHPRGARGDGGVHRRPLPAGLRGRAAVRGQRAAVDAGVGGHEADHGGAGADRRGRGDLAVELPGRHRGHPARVRPRARLHDGLEAVGVRAHLRQHVRAAAARRGLPARHRQPRARPRRHRRAARPAPGRRHRRVHRLGRDRRARRARRRPQEPRAGAGRQRAADRVRRRRHRQGRRRRDHGLLLPRRAVLHGGGAHPRALVGEGSASSTRWSRAPAT